ncbi:MAG: TetR/AcrR family transcriptional regulator [Candidatus Dormibacteraeota bacterium]|uniref:TetR/AcrR family transcriptional regulator n=1 Tax=Candidatus Amunia macphersoniae TaxID=3127014 RepID=A0A934KSS6_9BACT|nr:TetR/AcrR family transcriptional regulator [Candidatus Dormibacteraeota bacterium]
MSVVAIRDRRAERYAATRREIIDAAWEVVRADGLGAISMRDLGARVGMRAQSLYGYFPSKEAIFDAMFAESNEELLGRVEALPTVPDPVDWMRSMARMFMQFCVEDPGRYQLLFQRPIPNFEPSAEALAPALQGLAMVRAGLRDCGITDERAFDAWTGVTGGLAAQQNANEPGGDRWVRLVDEVIDMYIEHYRPNTPR